MTEENKENQAITVKEDPATLNVAEQKQPTAQNTLTVEEKKPNENTLNVKEDKDSSRLNELEVKEQLYGLTEDEKKEKDALTGSLSQNTKKNTEWEKLPEAQVKDQDVLDSLYDLMISCVTKTAQYTESYLLYKIRQGRDAAATALDNKDGNNKNGNNKDGNNKDADKDDVLTTEYAKKQKEIKEQTEQDLSKVKDISKAIKRGTLFDYSNKDLLHEFEKITREDSKQGQKTYDAVKQLCTDKKSSKQDRAEKAEEFFSYNGSTIVFNFINTNAANNMAYAEVSHRAKHENMNAAQMAKEFDTSRSSHLESINKASATEQQARKEKISLDSAVLSKIDYDPFLVSPTTRIISKMSGKAVEYAALNADISERNPYVNAVKNTILRQNAKEENKLEDFRMTKFNAQHVFSGGTLKDAVNYMKELSHDTLQTTSTNNPNIYRREKLKKHIERLKNKGSNEIILQLRDRYESRQEGR